MYILRRSIPKEYSTMTKPSLLCGVLLSLAASSTLAGDFYVGASLGRSNVDMDRSETDAVLVSAGATGLRSSVDEHDTHYGLSLGYQLNPYLAFELGYADFGSARYRASFTGGGARAHLDAHGWTASVLGILPVGEKFSIFGRLGGIHAKVEADVDVTGPGGAAAGTAQDRDWSGLYGAGVVYALTPSIGLRGEFTRYDSLGGSNTGSGDVDTWSLGALFRF